MSRMRGRIGRNICFCMPEYIGTTVNPATSCRVDDSRTRAVAADKPTHAGLIVSHPATWRPDRTAYVTIGLTRPANGERVQSG